MIVTSNTTAINRHQILQDRNAMDQIA